MTVPPATVPTTTPPPAELPPQSALAPICGFVPHSTVLVDLNGTPMGAHIADDKGCVDVTGVVPGKASP
jgi:hypothetical protein